MAGAAERRLRGRVEGKIIRVVNDVRARWERSGISKIATHQYIEGLSAARSRYACNLPSPKNGLRHVIGLASELLPFAVWQFVDVTHSQLVAEIRRRWPPLRGNIMRVLHVTLVHVAVRRSHGFREGVGSQDVEAARETMLERGL